ncbi:cell division protein ZapD [Thiomonas bhubaneswarensis]|uniref:Cell division protein ZapD n=1 Tax=Thiomonas bhubaneswarensis TaxID=339866 RepID=A0A0K6HY96_9BURK|nr:cell division protein ZapD [Thiomonas bhubaneswarensis]CUA95801.1 Cell division protein ZapD, interacts with FtsZ [Thiomonas bhubaneswarensis]
MILYEYPLHERVRTLLRLEHLFRRVDVLQQSALPEHHHFALITLFEILDVAARQDLKADILKELERQRQTFMAYRGNPSVAETVLDAVLGEIEQAFQSLSQQQGRVGQNLQDNEWLMAIRSRANIPGGTCEFDLPAYYAWQHLPQQQRQSDLARWLQGFAPLASSVELLLRLLRDAGSTRKLQAVGGSYQQQLAGKTYQLLRLRIDGALGLVPEITGHRLMVSVRFMQPDSDWRMTPSTGEVPFDMTLCP